jgi:chromosome segregation ATPase
MAKQTAKKGESGIEEQLVKRDEVQQRLDGLLSEIAEAVRNRNDKKQAVTTARRELEAFMEERGESQSRLCASTDNPNLTDWSRSFSKDRLNDTDKESFELLNKQLETAVKEAATAEAELDALRDEEQSLLAELLDPATATEEIILFKKRLSDAVQKIESLREQIALQEEIIETTRSGLPSLDGLHLKREDLLAEIATGNATENQLAELDSLIASEKKKISESLKDADATIEHARQTISGLKRMLAVAEEELATLELRDKTIVSRFLRIEAEKAGSEYARHAGELVAKFRQLIALGRIMTNKGCDLIDESTLVPLSIPRFKLNAHDQEGTEQWYLDGEPILPSLRRRGLSENDIESEIERMSLMGIGI